MQQASGADSERQLISILRVLGESPEPIGSTNIARKLEQEGILLSDRRVRYYLRIADIRGYTQPMGRVGRMITRKGRQQEIQTAK